MKLQAFESSPHELVPLQRAPLYIVHLQGGQYYAVETQAQYNRNQQRQNKLESARLVHYERDERMQAEALANSETAHEEAPVVEHMDIDIKNSLAAVLLQDKDEATMTQEELHADAKVTEMVATLSGNELFELLFEYKMIFDVLDFDSSGEMRLDEIVRAYRSYGVDLLDERDVEDGGYGKGEGRPVEALRRQLSGQSMTFTKFAKYMLIARGNTHPEHELMKLFKNIRKSEAELLGADADHSEKQDKIMLEVVDDVLLNLGVPSKELEEHQPHQYDLLQLQAEYDAALEAEKQAEQRLRDARDKRARKNTVDQLRKDLTAKSSQVNQTATELKSAKPSIQMSTLTYVKPKKKDSK